jgi:molecular chaperone GrpE
MPDARDPRPEESSIAPDAGSDDETEGAPPARHSGRAESAPFAADEDDMAAVLSADAAALAAMQAELSASNDKFLRLYAEFDNFRRRAVRDRQDAEKMGMGAVMKGLLDTLDDLGRVAHMTPSGTDAKSVIDGVEMVEKKLLKSLAGHGLEVVNPTDQKFDPALHEAITTAPAASADEDHMVAQVYQVGYVLNGTLLRPARVVVKQWNG